MIPTAAILPPNVSFPIGCAQLLERAGVHGVKILRNSLFVADGGEVVLPEEGTKVEVGCMIDPFGSRDGVRVTIRPSWRRADGFTPGTKEAARIESLLIHQGRGASAKSVACRNLLERLVRVGADYLPGREVDVSQCVSMEAGDSSHPQPLTRAAWHILREQGPAKLPSAGIYLAVCHPEKSSAVSISRSLERIFRSISCMPRIGAFGAGEAAKRLRENGTRGSGSSLAFLVVAEGGRNCSDTEQLLQQLTKAQIPHRLVFPRSLEDPLSRNALVVSLLEMLGGQALKLRCNGPLENAWWLGFDLGHPGRDADSIPVMSVLDPTGRLSGWWKSRQKRDETFGAQTLSEASAWLRELFTTVGSVPKHIVVLRDGRVFENDAWQRFLTSLPSPSTFATLAKNPAPLLLEGHSTTSPGRLWSMRDNEGILQTNHAAASHQLAAPLRILVERSSHGVSLEDISAGILGLCHLPVFGLRPSRVPAPIHWSDHLARGGGGDIRYGGFFHVAHHDARFESESTRFRAIERCGEVNSSL